MSSTTKHPSLLAHFRSFCFQNSAKNFEEALEYFAVFGGTGWSVDLSRPLDALIEEKVLKNYRYIHGDIAKVTQSNPEYHALLTAIACGDRREHSAFRNAKSKREEGEEAIDFLVTSNILVFDKSVEKPLKEADALSDKLLFLQPFMRFWFFAISPYYKGIREGDFKEMKTQWINAKHNFSDIIYEQLLKEVLKEGFKDDAITSIGGYWDKYIEIDILAKRKSGKWIAGTVKHGKSKANKTELTKLKENCKKAELEIDTYVIYAKNKFSSELKKEKGEKLKLLSLRNMAYLMDDLSVKDVIKYENKRY
jgi:hypothetical protein